MRTAASGRPETASGGPETASGGTKTLSGGTATVGDGRGPASGRSSEAGGHVRILTRELTYTTEGHGDILPVGEDIARELRQSGLAEGTVTVFVPGATGAVTTLEYEPGVVSDFRRLFDEIAGPDRDYRHNRLLGDGNGHSHVRAGVLGPSLVVPFSSGRLLLGTWQEICLVCFDNRPRERRVVLQFTGIRG